MAAEDDIFTFFSSLSPQDQQSFLMNFGDQGQQQDAYQSEAPQEMMGMGAPTTDMTSLMLGQMAGSGGMPQLTTKGAVDPLDLSQLAQRLNYTQDIGGSMFDNAVALFAGPDAFGSMNQFAPITRYTGQAVPASYGDDGTPTPVTKSSMMLQVAKKSGGARGFLADLIDQGTDPEAAVAALREIVTNGANAQDPALRKQAEEIRRTLDVWRTSDPLTGETKQVDRNTAPWEAFDEDSLRKTATDMFEQKLTDEMSASTLEFDPQTGKYYQGKTTEDSPSTKKFRDAGLPTPNESYTDPARLDAMNESVDPGYQMAAQGYQQQDQARADDLETQRQALLAKQLDLQGWDQRLNAISTPGAAPKQGRPPQQDQITSAQANTQLPQGFSARTQPGAPTMGNVPNGPYQMQNNVLPPGFSIRTQPNAPTLQGVDQRGQPQVQKPQTVMDSYGNPRTTHAGAFDFDTDLISQIFGNIQKSGAGVKNDQRLKARPAQADRKQLQKQDQQWRDTYNRNYAAANNRQSTESERMADMMRGAMRARAQVSTPLQDTMLARLMSLKSRAGI
jgi:hypothetical protein